MNKPLAATGATVSAGAALVALMLRAGQKAIDGTVEQWSHRSEGHAALGLGTGYLSPGHGTHQAA